MLTTAIIATNEENRIERAIRSALSLGPVLVVDGGSTDATIDRARAAGADVIVNPWPGFAAQRRFAIDAVKTEWLLFLDADEEITPELAREIQSLDYAADGYRIPRRSLFLGKWMMHGSWGRDRVLRLFRRTRGTVKDRAIHEEVEIDGRVETLRGLLLHYSQDDFASIAKKFAAYIPLSAREIAARRKSISLLEMLFRSRLAGAKEFILRRSFLDGWRGFVLASWIQSSVLAKYAEAKRLLESDQSRR